MKIGISDVVQAFDEKAVGTKVLDKKKFQSLLGLAVATHDARKDTQPGQLFVMLPKEACELVSAGVGRHTHDPKDYVIRQWRGEVQCFLRREKATKSTDVACVIYTREAYKSDPEVNQERFLKAFPTEDTTHCIVAVLAFAGPKPPVGPVRFVANLAGANNEYDIFARVKTGQENKLVTRYEVLCDEVRRIVNLAGDVIQYHRDWCVVAD